MGWGVGVGILVWVGNFAPYIKPPTADPNREYGSLKGTALTFFCSFSSPECVKELLHYTGRRYVAIHYWIRYSPCMEPLRTPCNQDCLGLSYIALPIRD